MRPMSHAPSHSSSFVIQSGLASRRAKNPAFRPLYQQIKELILRSLGAGDWPPGSMIPSEIDLAAQYGVSQGTVRKAIDELAAENLLVRLQGKGTFVASHSDPNAPYRFLRLRPDDGRALEKRSQALSCAVIPADETVASAFAIQAGDPVIAVERILCLNNDAAAFDQIFLAADSFAGLTLEMLRQEQRPFYGILEGRFGVRMIHAEEKLRAITADARVAERLALSNGTPILLVERTAYTYGDKVVEWRRGFYRTDRYHYANELG